MRLLLVAIAPPPPSPARKERFRVFVVEAVREGVGEPLAVRVGVEVGEGLLLGEPAPVGEAVRGEEEGVMEGLAPTESVGVGVGVAEGVGVAVREEEGVGVAVCVGEGVEVG